ncbi:hypothetical protein QI633_06135 [Nocardioides sp. QY071]|uniref:hypothetical protein n=1 Tax=Nocardioides sp. QY071 TaxID=3044187 RepID=UPI00249AD532|nr:hypothetical protein [Nocardioides sp. QY071]WGY03337.1 hypothetical protein QI633_06135 [Nocardioides sp. QY071]
MKLSELATWRFEASKAASDQARTLALAGLGIVWLFAGPFYTGKGDTSPSSALQLAGAALALGLALDLAQLVGRTIALEVNYRRENREADPAEDDPTVSGTPGVALISGLFFYLKVVALCVGYGAIVLYFARATF